MTSVEQSDAFDLRPNRGPIWWRHKGHIGPLALVVLTLLASLPLLIAYGRIIAEPGGDSLSFGDMEMVRAIGQYANQHFTLDWIPPSDRRMVLYLLLLPSAAMLVTIVRLVFGIRVLGLRAIYLAIGFKAIGILPSLALMLLVIGVTVVIRPWFRRIQLPLYARLPVILCMSAMMMVGALMLAPWFASDTLRHLAFFPVVIMAMLAEGIAKTIERDSVVMAVWRAVWTILLALLVLVVAAPLAQFSFRFPELILTQLVAIVFIAEFWDLRLMENWPARIERFLAGARPWYRARPKVAVVRNRGRATKLGTLGRPAPEGYESSSVQKQVDALREQGFEVKVFEGGMDLARELSSFMPPDLRLGTPGGVVLNLATGVQGEGRFCQVPAFLEMIGVPYTGPDPLAHAHQSDRFALMSQMGRAGVTVPRHYLVFDPTADLELNYPASARPRFEPDAPRIVVRNRSALHDAVETIQRRYGQPAVVEEIVLGRKISVGILGNDQIQCLPLLEITEEGQKDCPARLSDALAEKVRACARAAYRSSGCRDYARIDIRISPLEDPVVIDVKWVAMFARRGAFVSAAEAAGYSYGALLRRIVNEAARRYLIQSQMERAAKAPTEESAGALGQAVQG